MTHETHSLNQSNQTDRRTKERLQNKAQEKQVDKVTPQTNLLNQTKKQVDARCYQHLMSLQMKFMYTHPLKFCGFIMLVCGHPASYQKFQSQTTFRYYSSNKWTGYLKSYTYRKMIW